MTDTPLHQDEYLAGTMSAADYIASLEGQLARLSETYETVREVAYVNGLRAVTEMTRAAFARRDLEDLRDAILRGVAS